LKWWKDPSNLLKNDIILISCDGPGDTLSGPPHARDVYGNAYAAMHDYLSGGGRVFLTHFQYNWFAPPTGPSDFQSIGNWTPRDPANDTPPFDNFYVDTTFPKGKAYADWLDATGTTFSYGQFDSATKPTTNQYLIDTRSDMGTLDPSKAQRWIYNANGRDDANYSASYFTFNTPVGAPVDQQCGLAVYTDVHVGNDRSSFSYPKECTIPAMPAYQTNNKALEFLFFDLSSCVQDPSKPPPPPPPR
jgi:hypothetical protein